MRKHTHPATLTTENPDSPGAWPGRWARSLGSIMTQQHRMVVLVDDYHPIPDDLAHPWTCMHLMSVAELIKAIDKPPGTAKEWWTLHEEAIREAHQGSSIRMGMISVVARKQGES
jgi:hypothetical protein